MFSRILANLAFSPSSIDQLAFYATRLKKEQSIRRLGLALIVFSMAIQLFVAMAPPQKSLAASDNDVIRGGIDTVSQLKAKYDSHADVRALYNRFGLSANDLNNAKNTTFNFQNKGKDGVRSVGRVNFTYTDDNYLGSFSGSKFYSRSAAEWHGSEPAYYFNKLQGTDGNYYYVWVLKNCGNIAYKKAPAPAPAKPKPAPVKKTPTKPTPAPTKPTVATTTPTTTVKPKPDTPTVVTPAPTVVTPTTVETPTPVCENNPKLKPDDKLCYCIDNTSITADDARCTTPERSKTVRNITHGLSPTKTVNTAAKANDVIEYTLTTKNVNTVAKTAFVTEDNIADVLDYATVDTAYLQKEGGTFNAATKTISWPAEKIAAKGKITNRFRVIVKPIIPSTNQPNATATDFDCKMQNGYGNETTVPIACAPIKQIEHLPNTGPGETAAIGFTVSVISGYFFMRSRLLGKEVKAVKRIYQNAGV